ncbi:MAG: APC family permease [Candidatus Dormibacteraeota bacterium]|nr:APC family permease [Candidatus Dormibacteraeota bacterium]
MTAVVTAGASATTQPQLKKGALGLWDDTIIAVSSTAPAYSIATSLGALAAAVALAGPAAVWLGFIPVTGIAVAYYYLNRADPNCGAAYTWASKALHPSVGFMNGWLVILTDVLFMSFAAPQAGAAMIDLLNAWGLSNIGEFEISSSVWYANYLGVFFGVLFLGLVTYMVMVGIKVAANFQWVLLSIEYLIVLGFSILGFFKGGGSGFDLGWLNPLSMGGLSGIAAGVVISVFFYWGWDTTANLNEETEDGTENPGRAGIIGMFLLLVLFLLASISIQYVLTPQEIQDNSATALTAFANKLVGPQWGSLAILAFLSSTVATLQTTLLPSVRTAFSMGRDGMLGPIWAVVSTTWRTPWLGTLIMGGVSAVIAIASLKLGGLNAIVGAGVTSIGLLVAFYYGVVGISCAVYYRHALTKNVKGFIFAGVYPVLSALSLFALAGYLIWTDWNASADFAFDASNGKFLVAVPAFVLLSAIPALLYSYVRRRPKYLSMPTESAPADALSPHSAGAR